ncbi:MAG: hypothetical protein ABIN91_19765 [Mucilaginibacter sp.]|uniref:hypothetical protein n=1 Tax=Mucilaginibacter sp. TaxID=1882438 RepID=UPI003263FA44
MKNTKLMLMLAIVFASLAFNLKANAQNPEFNTVPCEVHLISISGLHPSYPISEWWVKLHNNTTNEDYISDTWGRTYDSGTGFRMADVPEGYYSVTISFTSTQYFAFFDWNVKGVGGYSSELGEWVPDSYTEGYSQQMSSGWNWNIATNVYVNYTGGLYINLHEF